MKLKAVKYLLVIILLTLFSACASVPLAPPETDIQVKDMSPPPGKALLYVYRNNLFAGSAVMYDIYIDETRIEGQLAVNTFLAVVLEPGEHRFSSMPSHVEPSLRAPYLAEKNLTIDVTGGSKYYIKISAASSPAIMGSAAPEAFKDSKLVQKSRKPVSISAAKVKDRDFSPPAVERKPPAGSDVDILPAVKAKANQNNYAIVIGIEEYREKLPKAEYAADDARLVAEYFTKSLGVPEENLVILTNGRASKSDLEKYFHRWLPNNVTKDSEVFIYFSGHGAPNPAGSEAFLVPFDGDPTYIAETGYPLHKLYEVLARLPSKRNMVILDSCFSGSGNRSVIAKGLRPLVVTAASPAMIGRNTAVLSASAGNQVSSTYLDKGHGLLTYFVLKGLKEEPVLNQEGRLEVEKLYPYVKRNVESTARKKYNNEQTPQLIGGKNN